MAVPTATEASIRGAMLPVPHRVVARVQETADTWTLELEPLAERIRPRAGQFDMLYAFGIGEVPISTSGDHDGDGPLTHTVRAVGAVTRALCALEPGAVVGVRGPFGTEWPLSEAMGCDLVVVAGGIGLAPLRPAIRHALDRRDDFGAVSVLVGARTPGDLLFADECARWATGPDVEVAVTVDAATPDSSPPWTGRVGLVTTLIPDAAVDPGTAVAFVCGPEVMMTFVVRALVERGLSLERIWVSMERNMRCAVGHCGHCQLGPTLICRDGPVFAAGAMAPLMAVREL